MVDNTTLPIPPGATNGDIVRDIDRAGVKTQVVQLDIGGAAAESLVTGTLPVSGNITVANASLAVTGTFFQATQPVSIAASVAVTGPLTDAQLRAAVVPVSLTSTTVTTLPALVAGSAIVGKVGIDQTTPGTTNLVSIGTNGTVAINAALPIGANIIGALSANQSVNKAQINGVTPLMGNGVTGTGSQRVTIASDNTAFAVNATGPALTKGTQGATGYTTQNLKDAGRVIFSAATVIAGVTVVTVEALLSLVVTRDGVAAAGATSFAVTAGKRLRITGISVGMVSTAAAVLSMRFALRMNPAGAAVATSPIQRIFAVPSGAALAQAGGELEISIPDGIEFSGTHQFGITQIGSVATGTCWVSLTGFEY